MKFSLLFGLLAASVSLIGCGNNCQGTCQQIYSADACGLQFPGRKADQLIRECVSECENALARTGEIGDYDPNKRTPPTVEITLENEQQAAAWMDCVWATAPNASEEECKNLDPGVGYCAPI